MAIAAPIQRNICSFHLLRIKFNALTNFPLKKGIQLKHVYEVPSSFLFNPIQGGGKNACGTYFGHISSTEARIFMKFETYVHKIVLDHQPHFHKDPCKDARARGLNARTHVKKKLCVSSLG